MNQKSTNLFNEACESIAFALLEKIEETDPDIIIPDCFLPSQFLEILEDAGWRYIVTSRKEDKSEKVTALIKEEDLAFSSLNGDSMSTETTLHLKFAEAMIIMHNDQEIYENLEKLD